MGIVEAQCHEARLVALVVRLRNVAGGPFGNAQVGVALFGLGIDSDVPDGGFGDFRRDDELFGWVGALAGLEAWGAAQWLITATVQDLAGDEDFVAGVLETLGHPGQILAGHELALGVVLWAVGVDAGGGWPQTGHKAGTRGAADGGLAMGVGKEHAALRKSVHVWGGGLGMALTGELAVLGRSALVGQATDPVVEIVNGDQQYVVALSGAKIAAEDNQEAEESSHEARDVSAAPVFSKTGDRVIQTGLLGNCFSSIGSDSPHC